jgi:hypothetical protein
VTTSSNHTILEVIKALSIAFSKDQAPQTAQARLITLLSFLPIRSARTSFAIIKSTGIGFQCCLGSFLEGFLLFRAERSFGVALGAFAELSLRSTNSWEL